MPKLQLNKLPTHELSALEKSLLNSGVQALAGVDEVGRGCLAGPVVAACVIYPAMPGAFPAVTDSKLLSPVQRESLFDQICQTVASWAVASVSAAEIDVINIHHASLKAMALAVEQMPVQPDYLLVDGKFPTQLNLKQQAVVAGDRQCRIIGAASILAKVWRDRLMTQYQAEYPNFSFAQHKGYPTKQHREEIKQHGLTPLHRRSFKGCNLSRPVEKRESAVL